jgi:hypothetical protein
MDIDKDKPSKNLKASIVQPEDEPPLPETPSLLQISESQPELKNKFKTEIHVSLPKFNRWNLELAF